jgi:hypothetical protein
VSGEAWQAFDQDQRYAVLCRAVYARAGTEVFLSHASALPFLGAPLWGLDLREVHATRRDARSGRREAGVRQHCALVEDIDIAISHDVRHSSGTRAALETTTIASVEAGLVVANSLLHDGHTTLADLRNRYERTMRSWPHTLRTRLVLSLATPLLESPGESRLSYWMWHHGLPGPVAQYEVRDSTGSVCARLDFAWPDRGVWVEFDGRAKYESLGRPGESVADVVLREKAREDMVRELTGWICVRVTWADLSNPARLMQRLEQAFASAERIRRRAPLASHSAR